MIMLAFAVLGFVAFRAWTRLGAFEAALAGLDERLRTLETARAPEKVRLSAPAKAPADKRPVTTPEAVRLKPDATEDTASPVVSRFSRTSTAVETGEGLETRIGSRWLLYVGVVAIVVGVSYFEKLAIDNHWVSETARVIQAAVAGLVLVGAGMRFARTGYRFYGQILSGAGMAVLYVATYAAFNFYHLIPQPAAFALMSFVTMMGALLASHEASEGLAIVAVSGGFATPFLLPASSDAEVALFGYDLILIAGTIVLSRLRRWPRLNVISFAFTVLTVVAWAASFYAPSKYLTTELFLTAFGALFLFARHVARDPADPSAKAARAVLSGAPVLYYIASLAILWVHSPALLIYLVLLSFAGAAASTLRPRSGQAHAPSGSSSGSGMRVMFWLAAAEPLLIWSGAHGTRAWLVPGLAAWASVFLVYLGGLLEATLSDGGQFGGADIALLHLNGLGVCAGSYLLIHPVLDAATGSVAAGLALVHGALSVAVAGRRREEALHFAALAFTLLTVAIALQFEGVWVTSGWAAEGAAVMWLGLRERRTWLRAGGLVLFAVATLSLLAALFAPPTVGQVLLLNRRALCGLFVIGLTCWLAYVHERQQNAARGAVEAGIALVTGALLTLALAVSEILAYWKLHAPPPFEPDAQIVAAYLTMGSVTVWLGLKRRQEWMRAIGGAVVALGALALFTIQLQSVPREYVTLLNGRAAVGLMAILALYTLALLHQRLGKHLRDMPAHVAILTTAASLFTLSLVTSEIDAFWGVRGAADVWSMSREGLQVIAWSGIGGFLMWRGVAGGRGWIRAIGAVLLAVAISRLLITQLSGVPPAYLVVANARVLAALVLIAVLYGLALVYQQADRSDTEGRHAPTALGLLANVVTLTLLTSEITGYWHVRDLGVRSSLGPATSHFAREMMVSITWAIYATLLVVVGLKKRYAPIRYFALTLFVVTIVKVFAIDLAEIDRIYRVLSVIGLGIALLLTSYLYQRSHVDRRV